MRTLFVILFTLFLIATGNAQMSCFSYNNGKMLSCDTPKGMTNITQLSPNQGVITGPNGRMDPYTVMPSTVTPHGIQPLSGVTPLNRLDAPRMQPPTIGVPSIGVPSVGPAPLIGE